MDLTLSHKTSLIIDLFKLQHPCVKVGLFQEWRNSIFLIIKLCNYLVTLGLLNQQKDWLVGFLRILAELLWLAADFFLLLASAKLSLGWAG